MLEETSLQLICTSSNDIWHGNMGTRHSSREQTKMERSILNFTYRDRKTNIWIREKIKVKDVMNMLEDRSGPGQGTSAGYKVTDEHCVSPPGNPTKGKYLEEGRQDGGETN